MLANYRTATLRDQALSVAEQLSQELNSIHANFQTFLEDAITGGKDDAGFSVFLEHGLNEFHQYKMYDLYRDHKNLEAEGMDLGLDQAEAEEEDVEARAKFKPVENDVLDRVNSAFADCVASVELAEPGGKARLCDVYRDIHAKLKLKSSLFGVCDFKDGISSVEAFCTVFEFDSFFFVGLFELRFVCAQVLQARPVPGGPGPGQNV